MLTADGRIGGFFGCTSGPYIDKKIKLLKDEGVVLTNGKAEAAKCFSEFDVSMVSEENVKAEMEEWQSSVSKQREQSRS